jgi:hypothetical protein
MKLLSGYKKFVSRLVLSLCYISSHYTWRIHEKELGPNSDFESHTVLYFSNANTSNTDNTHFVWECSFHTYSLHPNIPYGLFGAVHIYSFCEVFIYYINLYENRNGHTAIQEPLLSNFIEICHLETCGRMGTHNSRMPVLVLHVTQITHSNCTKMKSHLQ